MQKLKTQNISLTIAVQQELKALKKQINDGHEVIEALVAKTKDKANETVAETIITGERLNKVKSLLPYGQFHIWLKENCKSISIKTAQRYMTLATRKSQLLKTDIGLRKAYALVGIIKEDSTDELCDTSASTGKQTATPVNNGSTNKSLAQKAADKARSVKSAIPSISKDDALSRAKFLARELTIELNSKINNELIVKQDARQIIAPLIELVQD